MDIWIFGIRKCSSKPDDFHTNVSIGAIILYCVYPFSFYLMKYLTTYNQKYNVFLVNYGYSKQSITKAQWKSKLYSSVFFCPFTIFFSLSFWVCENLITRNTFYFLDEKFSSIRARVNLQIFMINQLFVFYIYQSKNL